MNGFIFLVTVISARLLYKWMGPSIDTDTRTVTSVIYAGFGGILATNAFIHYKGHELYLQLALYGVLFLIAVIDQHHMVIPDSLQVLYLALTFLDSDTQKSFWGVVTLFLITYLSTKLVPDGIGGGDVKFLMITGYYLGPMKGSQVLMLACLVALVVLLFQSNRRNHPIPFGPFLVLALFLVKECFI